MIKILHLVLYSDDQYFNQMYDILNNFYLRSGVFLQKDLYRGRNYDKDFEIFNVPWDVMLDIAYDLLPPSVKYDLTTQKGYLCNNIIDFNCWLLSH